MTVLITDNKSCYSVYEPEYKWLHSTFKGIVDYGASGEWAEILPES